MFVNEIYDELVEILATADKAKIFRKLSQAIQVLMESGHYFALNQEVDVCTGWDGQTVTLPRGIEVPLAVNVDGSPTYFRGRLFQYSVNKGGMYSPVSWAWDDRGMVSTAMEIVSPAQLVAVAEHSSDASLSLRVIGTDANNRELRTQTIDGINIDGLNVPIHAISDFPLGVILPDPVQVDSREVKVSPFINWTTEYDHDFVTGQDVTVGIIENPFTGILPAPLQSGEKFYVGVTGSNTLQLFQNEFDALAGNNPVRLQSLVGVTPNETILTNTIGCQLYTSVKFASAPPIAIDNPNEVTFAPIGSNALPFPLLANTTYFVSQLDATNLLIYTNSTSAAAQDDSYISLTGSSAAFYTYIRKPITPQTKLTFTVEPQFQNGDSVQAYTSNGVLPQPLIKGQTYYVHRIAGDSKFGTTLHVNYAEAISGENPINLITNGSGSNSIAKLIPATAFPGTKSNISAPGLSIPTTTSGTGAVIVPQVSGPVTSAQITGGGSGGWSSATATFSDVGGYLYTSTPSVNLVGGLGTGATFQAVRDPSNGGFISQVNVLTGGSGYTDASLPTVEFLGGYTPGVGFPAKGRVVVTNGAVSAIVLEPYGVGAAATVSTNSVNGTVNGIFITNPGSGYYYPPRITITGNGSGTPTASCAITPSFVSSYRISSPGSGYTNVPAIYVSGGSGTGASATATVSNGAISSVNVLTQGTGYSTPPSVTVFPSTGVYVQFSSTGTLPAPLVQGVAYRAETPSSEDGTFTVKNSDFSDVTITSAGSGTFYVALSRTFGIGFTNIWEGDFNGVSNGQSIYFGSDYLLPITSPATSASVAYYVQKIAQNQVKLYTSYSNGAFTGLISVAALGSGQSYYAIRLSSNASVYNNLISPYNTKYLRNGTSYSFRASNPNGTLPAPLQEGAYYDVRVSGTKIYLIGVEFTSLGTGQLYMDNANASTPNSSKSLIVDNCLLETGDQITFRASENDELPFGIDEGVSYFAHKISKSEISLHNTIANAQNNIFPIAIDSTGKTVNSYFYGDSIQKPILVKSVLHIEKPVTQGYVSLYAFDYGRSNDMTLIGQYHPNETNPKYRRIRIGQKAAWVRMLYRVKAPIITSQSDYIPIENQRAIIAAVHAVDLEDKDFMEQAQKYWLSALTYLRQQNESLEGHAFTPPQINNITYGDGTDCVMF